MDLLYSQIYDSWARSDTRGRRKGKTRPGKGKKKVCLISSSSSSISRERVFVNFKYARRYSREISNIAKSKPKFVFHVNRGLMYLLSLRVRVRRSRREYFDEDYVPYFSFNRFLSRCAEIGISSFSTKKEII